jgi:hypothetical protein
MTVNELIRELQRVSREGRGGFKVVYDCSEPVDWVMRGSEQSDADRTVHLKQEVDW